MSSFIIFIFTYTLGYALAYLMLLTELKSEGQIITIGDRALMCFLSLFSWLTIFYNITMAWINQIGKTGYWNKPVKESEVQEAKVDPIKLKGSLETQKN